MFEDFKFLLIFFPIDRTVAIYETWELPSYTEEKWQALQADEKKAVLLPVRYEEETYDGLIVQLAKSREDLIPAMHHALDLLRHKAKGGQLLLDLIKRFRDSSKRNYFRSIENIETETDDDDAPCLPSSAQRPTASRTSAAAPTEGVEFPPIQVQLTKSARAVETLPPAERTASDQERAEKRALDAEPADSPPPAKKLKEAPSAVSAKQKHSFAQPPVSQGMAAPLAPVPSRSGGPRSFHPSPNPLAQMDAVLENIGEQNETDPRLIASALGILSRMMASVIVEIREVKSLQKQQLSQASSAAFQGSTRSFAPAENVEQFQVFLTNLHKNAQLKADYVQFLYSQGGKNVGDKVRRMAGQMATNFVLSHFNRSGRPPKNSFLQAECVLKEAILADKNSTTCKEIEKAIEDFLSDVPRMKGGIKFSPAHSPKPTKPPVPSSPSTPDPRPQRAKRTPVSSSGGADAYPEVPPTDDSFSDPEYDYMAELDKP